MKLMFATALLVLLFFVSSCSGSRKTISGKTGTGSSVSTAKIDYAMLNNSTFALADVSADASYGYKVENPIKVGGSKEQSGPANERRFLNALLGPNGEAVTYNRLGSCCAFETPNGLIGNTGLLDKYEVKYEGLEKPIILYINMYDYGELKAPKGFTFKK